MNEFVEKEFSAAKSAAKEAVKIAFIEMKKRHDGILTLVMKEQEKKNNTDQQR